MWIVPSQDSSWMSIDCKEINREILDLADKSKKRKTARENEEEGRNPHCNSTTSNSHSSTTGLLVLASYGLSFFFFFLGSVQKKDSSSLQHSLLVFFFFFSCYYYCVWIFPVIRFRSLSVPPSLSLSLCFFSFFSVLLLSFILSSLSFFFLFSLARRAFCRLTLKNPLTNVEKIIHVTPDQTRGGEDHALFKDDDGVELEVFEKISLSEWLVNNYKSFGTTLDFVTNKYDATPSSPSVYLYLSIYL